MSHKHRVSLLSYSNLHFLEAYDVMICVIVKISGDVQVIATCSHVDIMGC